MDLQGWVLLGLGVAALGMEIFALVDAARRPAGAFTYAGKLTKPIWLGILAVAALVGFVTVRYVLGIGLVGVIAAGVYLADVRPAVKQFSPRRGGSNQGPYGAW